ncbi:NADP-binding protein [Dacryopinax primogenitus]|uniref:NADP-binding protein n=1 Tax=Dacryopinax primogenitus (strain DJM 731) TaxID=1858805 RepID=M5GBQ8_DACPD|nr:NADP-binding protein [Dacryopinax primogenitus]EJU01448.1 NADP-binding protein [Dacryopinax primogenitus]
MVSFILFDISRSPAGANGYLAVWILRTLLEQGYLVKGAVRSASKGEYLRKLFVEYGEAFSYVVVEDMAKNGAFDVHVRDVQAILHTAARATSYAKSLVELTSTNVNGTIGLLNSALTHGPNIRRFVYTSSTGTIMEEPGKTLTEETMKWKEHIVEEARNNPNPPGIYYYLASKVLAEQAAWAWAEEHKAEIKFDFVSLIVPWVIGPQIQEIRSRADLTEAISILQSGLDNEWSAEERYSHFANWADVRGIALAHVRAMEREPAGGQRFLISAGAFCLQDIYDVLHSVENSPLKDVPFGDPARKRKPLCQHDSSKAQGILGITFRPLGPSLTEALADHQAKLNEFPA